MKHRIKQFFAFVALILMLLFIISLMPELQAMHGSTAASVDKPGTTASLALTRTIKVRNIGYTNCTGNTLLTQRQRWKYPCIQAQHILRT